MIKVKSCTPELVQPLNVQSYYKYYINGTGLPENNANLTEWQGVVIDYDGFWNGGCGFETVVEISCLSCENRTSDEIIAEMGIIIVVQSFKLINISIISTPPRLLPV